MKRGAGVILGAHGRHHPLRPGPGCRPEIAVRRSPAPGGRGRTRYRPSRERSWGSASCHRAGPVRRPGRPRATSSSAVASDLTTFSVTSGLSATCCCARSRARTSRGSAASRAARPATLALRPASMALSTACALRAASIRSFAPLCARRVSASTRGDFSTALPSAFPSFFCPGFCGSIGPGYCRWRAHSRRGRHRTSATTQACHPLRPRRRRSIVRPYSLRRRRPGRNECRSDRAGRPAEVLPMFATLSAASGGRGKALHRAWPVLRPALTSRHSQ